MVGDTVDLARQAAGCLKQRLGGGWLEQRQFAACQTEAVSEVGVEFVALQAGDVMAHDEALTERLVNRHGQPAAQFGEADAYSGEGGMSRGCLADHGGGGNRIDRFSERCVSAA